LEYQLRSHKIARDFGFVVIFFWAGGLPEVVHLVAFQFRPVVLRGVLPGGGFPGGVESARWYQAVPCGLAQHVWAFRWLPELRVVLGRKSALCPDFERPVPGWARMRPAVPCQKTRPAQLIIQTILHVKTSSCKRSEFGSNVMQSCLALDEELMKTVLKS